MSPQQFAVLAVLCGTLVLHGWVAAGLAGLGSLGIENGGARIAVYTERAAAIANDIVDGVSVPDTGIIDAALPDPREVLPPVRIASASTPDPGPNDVEASAPPVDVAWMGNVRAAVPEPREMPPLEATAPARAPDPGRTMSRRPRPRSTSPRRRASAPLCTTLVRCCRRPRRRCSYPCSGLPWWRSTSSRSYAWLKRPTNASWPKSASTIISGRSTSGRPKSTRTG